MKVTRLFQPITLVTLIASLCIASPAVWGADAAPAKPATNAMPMPPAPSKEMREKMAQAHEKMAACLRSDKAFADCRQDMMNSCRDMGGPACGMMGDRQGMMHDMKGDHPMPMPPKP